MREALLLTIGFLVGMIAAKFWTRRGPDHKAMATPEPTVPLPDSIYAEARASYLRAYEKSIGEFDRLVIWGAGGAIALSIPLFRTDSIVATPQGKFWLGGGWLVLVMTILASTASHYASSRLFSKRLVELDEVQRGGAQVERHRAARMAFGRWTTILTFCSGCLLATGILLVAFSVWVSI